MEYYFHAFEWNIKKINLILNFYVMAKKSQDFRFLQSRALYTLPNFSPLSQNISSNNDKKIYKKMNKLKNIYIYK